MKESQRSEIFNEWIHNHRALLFKVVRSYADTEFDRNDLFQEVSIQIFRSVPNFRGASAVSTWLYRIALNTAIKWISKEKKHTYNHQSIEPGNNALEAIEDDTDDEKVRWLYKQIKQLRETDRSLTILLLDGYSYREMSEITGISESHVGVKIHRIKKQLMTNAKSMKNGI